MFLGIINLMQNVLFKANEEKKLRYLLMQNPSISNLHEKLGQYYLGRDGERAKNEYLLAQEYFVSYTNSNLSNVLESISPPATLALPPASISEAFRAGALRAGSPWQKWQSIEAKIQNTNREIEYWQKVTQTYPDYLYPYLKLSLLNWQKGERVKAKNYIFSVLIKDPTDKEAIKLSENLK